MYTKPGPPRRQAGSVADSDVGAIQVIWEGGGVSLSEGTRQRGYEFGLVLLQDKRLMHRIDALARQEYDTQNLLDSCPSCGMIQPGYRYCSRCLERIPRKRGVDSGYWMHEVAGEGHYQDRFQRIVALAPGGQDGGVHLWVTAGLVPDSDDNSGVGVSVITDGPAELVGFIPEIDAAAVRRACRQVARAYNRIVACKALINGGFMLEDGTTATYGISLLLPPVSRFLREAAQSILNEESSPSGETSFQQTDRQP